MKDYVVDITIRVRASSADDAFFLANSFCNSALESEIIPNDIEVVNVSEPDLER
jgi:hypothetical protein